jgi:hypothetical protein
VICAIILAFIFLTPPSLFNDRPDFMRIPGSDSVRESHDDNGNPVFTVKLDTPVFSSDAVNKQAAMKLLEQKLGNEVRVSRMQPLYDTTGVLVAYSIWIEK